MRTITVGTYEAKTNLAHLLGRVAKGTEVIITKHEKPIARLSAVTLPASLGRREALQRLAVIAGQAQAGPDSASDLINAGRRL